jgi:hypothetical protein
MLLVRVRANSVCSLSPMLWQRRISGRLHVQESELKGGGIMLTERLAAETVLGLEQRGSLTRCNAQLQRCTRCRPRPVPGLACLCFRLLGSG